MDQSESYTFWRKPWHKWLILAVAVLQMVGLWFQIQDYRAISQNEVRTKLFSQSAWESYATQQHFHFAISSLIIGVVLFCFFLGFFAKSKKIAELSTGILLIVFSFIWCLISFFIPIFTEISMTIFWGVFLIILLVGGIHSIWQSKKSRP